MFFLIRFLRVLLFFFRGGDNGGDLYDFITTLASLEFRTKEGYIWREKITWEGDTRQPDTRLFPLNKKIGLRPWGRFIENFLLWLKLTDSSLVYIKLDGVALLVKDFPRCDSTNMQDKPILNSPLYIAINFELNI